MTKIDKHINKGVCIFCKKDKTQTTFKERAHTVPKSLGGQNIGKDVCDECNHYFGEPDKSMYPRLSIEVCVKEILGLSQILLQEKPDRRLKSKYFNYYHNLGKIVIKPQFKSNQAWLQLFARQFKRGMYEMWLQEYHMYSYDGLNPDFNEIRRFARYNIGDIPLYYLVNNGCVPVEKNIKNPTFNINEKSLQDMYDYGFYTLLIEGHFFIFEITSKARLSRELYLRKLVQKMHVGGFVYRELIEIKSITDIDFSYYSLFSSNNK